MSALISAVVTAVWGTVEPYIARLFAYLSGRARQKEADNAKAVQSNEAVAQKMNEAVAEAPKSVTDLQTNVLAKDKF